MTMNEFTTLLGRIDAVGEAVVDCRTKLEAHLAVTDARNGWRARWPVLISSGAAVASTVVAWIALLSR